MKDQKVNFIIADINIVGGVEKVTHLLSTAFAQRGAVVTVHSLYSTKSEQAATENIQVVHHGLAFPDREKNVLLKIKRLFLNGLTLRKQLLSKNSFLILQGFYIAAYLPFIKAKTSTGIVCEHNSFDAPGRLSRFSRFLLYRLFNPHIVVLTEADRRHYQSLGMKQVTKVYNPNPYPLTKANTLNQKNLISLGRFTHQKRFDLMIELCAPILKSHPDWFLKIQGAGEDLTKLELAIKLQALEDRVLILPLGEPTSLYQDGSIFLLTSQFEGLPMTLIESMSFGIPAIGFHCSEGLSEIIKDGHNGYLVEMDDTKSFIDKLKELMEDDSLRERLGSNAKSSVGNFNITKVIDDWEKIFK